MKSIKRIIFIAAACSLLAFIISAEEPAGDTGSLEGIVFHSDGKTPLKDARIILEQFEKDKKTGKEYESNITDSTGEYRLENIPVGKYRGKIMLNGKHYRIKRVDFFVHVIKGEINHVSFALKKGSK